MGCCQSNQGEYVVTNDASEAWDLLDHHKKGEIDSDKVSEWVSTNAPMWAMLGVNCGIGEEKCIEIATRVVMELITGLHMERAKNENINKDQFKEFRKRYVDDPKGSQEFFHRSVFAVYDEDGNAELDREEFDKFLGIFYEAGSIFKGDARLPEKEKLKELVYEKLDTDGNGLLSFEEIRSLISGSALRGDLIG